MPTASTKDTSKATLIKTQFNWARSLIQNRQVEIPRSRTFGLVHGCFQWWHIKPATEAQDLSLEHQWQRCYLAVASHGWLRRSFGHCSIAECLMTGLTTGKTASHLYTRLRKRIRDYHTQ